MAHSDSSRRGRNSCHKEILNRVPCQVVFDHLGHVPEPEGVTSPVFGMISDMLHKGKGWVKLSGFHYETKVGPPTYADSVAVASGYVKEAPDAWFGAATGRIPCRRQTRSLTMHCCWICSLRWHPVRRHSTVFWLPTRPRFTGFRRQKASGDSAGCPASTSTAPTPGCTSPRRKRSREPLP